MKKTKQSKLKMLLGRRSFESAPIKAPHFLDEIKSKRSLKKAFSIDVSGSFAS
jgi:hypothetical protein